MEWALIDIYCLFCWYLCGYGGLLHVLAYASQSGDCCCGILGRTIPSIYESEFLPVLELTKPIAALCGSAKSKMANWFYQLRL